MHPHIRSSADQQRLDLHSRYGIDSTRLVEIIQLMERSIEEPVDMTDIADRVGISARHMERLFLDQIGTRPRAFYLRLRVAKARRMLRQTLNSVQHVALECGFTSTSHFCHAYKREFGLAPMRERRRACL